MLTPASVAAAMPELLRGLPGGGSDAGAEAFDYRVAARFANGMSDAELITAQCKTEDDVLAVARDADALAESMVRAIKIGPAARAEMGARARARG